MPINFSGLASGLDTGSIVDSLVAIERSRANIFTTQKRQVEQRISTVGRLSGLLNDLKTKLDDFGTANEIRKMSVTTSNAENIKLTSTGAANPGSFAMRVTNLAQAQTSQSNVYATADPGVMGTGTLDLTVGSDAVVTIDYDSNDSLQEIADKITNSGARATASVLFDGTNYRIMVTSEETGLENAITFGETGDALGFTQPGAELLAAEDAQFTLNGIAITRPKNSVEDVIDGVTLDLLTESQLGDPDTIIQIAQDSTATTTKLQEFVDSYNAAIGLVTSELSFTGVDKDAGSLFGDSTIRALQRALSGVVSGGYTNGSETSSLGAIGLELDNTGKLSIDSTKLSETLASDPRAIDNIFAGNGGNDGLAKVLQDLVETYTQSGTGLLTTKTESLNGRIKVFDEQIERVESRAQSVADQLNKQFATLEQTMSRLNAQQQYLTALGF
ncbi:MAG: flagellar filament capping protein FliD [Kofleriaceae bacterium]|nr:flagellar filament capping protein FliD [Kofleriaceae bacterium]